MIKKVLNLLTPRESKRLYVLMTVMVISALIEVAGIASIMPFLSLITNPELIQDNEILNYFYKLFGFQSENRYLIFVGAVVLVILVLSNVLVFLTNWGLARFSWMRGYSISRRLLKRYLYQPYVFFLNKNSSILGKNILSETQVAVKGVIVPMLEIFASGVVVTFIFTMLVLVEPLLAVSMIIVLGGAYIFTYRLTKQRLNIRGKKRYKTNSEKFKAVNEAFGDIKQLKLMRFENFFIKRYSKPAADNAVHNASAQIIGKIPRYIMEIIAFGGIIIVVLYLLATGKGFGEFLPIIGLYAFSTYRLLPSFQAIFAGVAMIRFNSHAINSIYEEIFSLSLADAKAPEENIEPLSFNREIRLKNITFNYPDTKKPVVRDLDIAIKYNTSVAFVGATGAGKTTIANIILGLLKPESGQIIVDGEIVDEENTSNWQRNLGYIPQDIYLQDDTITRNITFGIPDEEIDTNAVIEAAKIANIHDFIEKELPKKYDTVVGERGVRLSGGQRQRIGIARAVYHNPDILVLDEATSALDSVTEQEVFKAIENISKTKTLIMIAHRLTTIQGCDVIYVLENGNVVGSGNYEELIRNNIIFRKMAKKQK